MNYKYILSTTVKLVFFVALFSFTTACKKDKGSDITSGGKVILQVSANISDFGQGTTIGNNKASLASVSNEKVSVLDTTIELSKDFLLQAELIPLGGEKNVISSSKVISKGGLQAADFPTTFSYRLDVFKSTGEYVTSRNYTRGSESSTVPLELDGGVTYTFIALSANTASLNDIPILSSSDINNRTLSNSFIEILDHLDLLYYKQNLMVSGEANDKLIIVFEHMFNEITVSIDASATGYNVETAEGKLKTINGKSRLNYSALGVVRSALDLEKQLFFSATGGPVATSTPVVVNLGSGEKLLYISKLKIGPLEVSSTTEAGSITLPSNIDIEPKTKYLVKLTIVPRDGYVTNYGGFGFDAVRINGHVWMRHNLGATISINPNQNPSEIGLHGNYYKWGKTEVVANASTSSDAIIPWDTTPFLPAVNPWNGGTEINPTKGLQDPCPDGYRIPTAIELNALVDETVQSNYGTWNPEQNNSTNYSAAKVFTSKRNENIKVIFPIPGNRDINNGALTLRGSTGYYWSSTVVPTDNSRRHHYALRETSVNVGYSATIWGMSIRCIAEDSSL